MNVDVFGRALNKNKGVSRGPPGIGFSLTDSGDFDIQNKRLCNIGDAKVDSDAVNLGIVNRDLNDMKLQIKQFEHKKNNELKEIKKRLDLIEEVLKIELKDVTNTNEIS